MCFGRQQTTDIELEDVRTATHHYKVSVNVNLAQGNPVYCRADTTPL